MYKLVLFSDGIKEAPTLFVVLHAILKSTNKSYVITAEANIKLASDILPARMNIAPPPKGDLIATMHKPLGESNEDGYISLGIETALPISNLTELLRRAFDLRAECIGPGGIGRSPTLVEAPQGQFWLLTLNPVKLKACEGRAIKPLITAGHIDPRLVRIAHRMPRGWTPPNTMREVGREVFLGHVEPGSPHIAVGFRGPTPTKTGGQTWVNWVVIDVSRLHLPG